MKASITTTLFFVTKHGVSKSEAARRAVEKHQLESSKIELVRARVQCRVRDRTRLFQSQSGENGEIRGYRAERSVPSVRQATTRRPPALSETRSPVTSSLRNQQTLARAAGGAPAQCTTESAPPPPQENGCAQVGLNGLKQFTLSNY